MTASRTTDQVAGEAAQRRHLFDVDALTVNGIAQILDEAERMTEPMGAPLRGKTVINFFAEASTRTRVSFQIAAGRLGAQVVNIAADGSSLEKGESLVDTVRTLQAVGAHALVIRHAEPGAPYLAARHFRGPVINAGDGRHAHPTQALLDLLTMRRLFGTLRGLIVAIVGDVTHSRVARSTALGLLLCGAQVRLCAPPTLLPHPGWIAALPPSGEGGTVLQTTFMRDALDGAQVVMTLRMQAERQQNGLLPNSKEYVRMYGITTARLAELAPDAVVMHPGPVNEGVEIAPELMTGRVSLISQQVENGVLVRMAVLKLLLGETGE